MREPIRELKKEVKYTLSTNVYAISKDISYIIYKKDDKITSSHFAKNTDFDLPKSDKTVNIKWKKKDKDSFNNFEYQLYQEGIYELIQSKPFHETNYGYDLRIEPKDVCKMVLNGEKIDVKNIIYPNGSNHLMYSITSDIPISPLYRIDYIGGFDNEKYRLKEVYEHLKKHPHIKSVEPHDIPYYNCEDGRSKYLLIDVVLPQNVYNKRWKSLAKAGERCPSVRMRDTIVPYSLEFDGNNFDPLKVKKFLKTKTDEDW